MSSWANTVKASWTSRLGFPLLLVGALHLSCLSGPKPHPVELPRIAGRIVDAKTGRPVADAEVYTSYNLSHSYPGDIHATWLSHAIRWTKTDGEGRFAFEPVRFESIGQKPYWGHALTLSLIDPRYGAVQLGSLSSTTRTTATSRGRFWCSTEATGMPRMKSNGGSWPVQTRKERWIRAMVQLRSRWLTETLSIRMRSSCSGLT